MYYVYLLKSKKLDRTYIGYTSDLRKRYREHNAGKVSSTKAYVPYVLVYYEAYLSSADARKREIELKKHSQRKELLFASLERSLNVGDVV
ncbi:MAG TPA: endonuclease [Elusimicrobia bacterium]|nr:endonuclease [Elusimicrobiota bacterium]